MVLIALRKERPLASVLKGERYAVLQVHSGRLAVEWARELRPDTIILEADLPDMSGIDACRMLHRDLGIGHNVPILMLAPEQPTAEQRVTALRAGVWDFLRYPGDSEQLTLKLQTYVQAKQNIDVALAESLVDPATGLHSRPSLVRRARQLGALMSREHGALACVVFALGTDAADPKVGSRVAQATRVSDVVGALSPTEFAVLAPATEHAGAVKLAERVASALRAASGNAAASPPESALRAGYDAVANLTYAPMDPADLLARASAAVRNGSPVPGHAWVRRFDSSNASGQNVGSTSRPSPSGLVLDKTRIST